AEHERIVAEEAAKAGSRSDFPFEIERSEAEEPSDNSHDARVTEITERFEEDAASRKAITPVEVSLTSDHADIAPDDAAGEFRAVSVPDDVAVSEFSSDLESSLRSHSATVRAAAVADLPNIGGEEAFRNITRSFDDESAEVRSTAARAL